MSSISFFTPIEYDSSYKRSRTEFLLEKVDDYFYLGEKKALIIKSSTKREYHAIFVQNKSSPLTKLRILSYICILPPVFMLIAKAILRSIYCVKLIDPKVQLEKGIELSNDIIEKTKSLMSNIFKKNSGLKVDLQWGGINFKLPDQPDVTFKINHDVTQYYRIEENFQNMIKAEEVCLRKNFNLLKISPAKKIEFRKDNTNYILIAEKRINPVNSKVSLTLDQKSSVIKQVVAFMKETKLEIHWDFIMEEMENPAAVIYLTSSKSRVEDLLANLVSEEDMNLAINEANNQKLFTLEEGNEAKEKRLKFLKDEEERLIKEIKWNEELKEFYKEKDPKALIDIEDLTSLNLDWEKEIEIIDAPPFTFKQTAEDVIKEINRLLNENFESKATLSIEAQRSILIRTSHGQFSAYNYFSLLQPVMESLKREGHIFDFREDGHGYHIQA